MNILISNYTSLFALIFFTFLMDSCKKAEPVVAEFSTDLTEIFVGDIVQFINTSENASFYQWDFGDGQFSFLESPTHVYDDPGTFKVTLVSIGGDESSTATRDIVVGQSFEVTIYEGVGIEGASISDSWSDIQSTFNSDTIYVRDTLENLGAYFHMAYFRYEGVAFVFINEDTLINDEDLLRIIYVINPYAGGTVKHIGIGSTMDQVEVVYGQPEDVVNGTESEAYWYDTKGIDFITFNSGLVDEIDIYGIATAKSASTCKSIVNDYLRDWERITPF